MTKEETENTQYALRKLPALEEIDEWSESTEKELAYKRKATDTELKLRMEAKTEQGTVGTTNTEQTTYTRTVRKEGGTSDCIVQCQAIVL